MRLSGGTSTLHHRRSCARSHRCAALNQADSSTAIATRARRRLEVGLQLYEKVWSSGRILQLEDIMAEDHTQLDMIWQPDRTDGGRQRMKRGILAFRKAYPDLKFTVLHSAVTEDAGQVFISWHAKGTYTGSIHDMPPTGERVDFQGVSVLSFNDLDQIQESRVFRQAPKQEAQYFTSQAAPAAGAPPSQMTQ